MDVSHHFIRLWVVRTLTEQYVLFKNVEHLNNLRESV